MDVILVVLGTAFAVWFGISVAAQFNDRAVEGLARLDMLGLIPRWTFFAPRPGIHDVHLLYRDRLTTGGLTNVSVVTTIEGRRWYHSVWNPHKARNKIVLDVMMSLGRQYLEIEKYRLDPRLVLMYPSYLMALNLVMREPRSVDVAARQFILARSQAFGSEDGAIIMASEFHSFPKT